MPPFPSPVVTLLARRRSAQCQITRRFRRPTPAANIGEWPPSNDGADSRGRRRGGADWIGTPYHHAADVKGHGVDCAMLLVRVYCDLGFVEPFDPRPYTRDWILHRNEEQYLGFLLARAKEVRSPEPRRHDPVPDRTMFRTCGDRSRIDPLNMIHAILSSGVS